MPRVAPSPFLHRKSLQAPLDDVPDLYAANDGAKEISALPDARRKGISSVRDVGYSWTMQCSGCGGHAVRVVSGEEVRDQGLDEEEFGLSAIHDDFDFIPENEIWFAERVPLGEFHFLLAGATTRLRALRAGKSPGEAYDLGLRKDREERRKATGGQFAGAEPDADPVIDRTGYCTIVGDGSERPVLVYLVDGGVVRSTMKTDFLEGGNHGPYPWVPESEIWIESTLDAHEMAVVGLHEYVERLLMLRHGYNYDRAHEIASWVEFHHRPDFGQRDLEAIMPDVLWEIPGFREGHVHLSKDETPAETPRTKAFTGKKEDSAGRTQCYQGGEHIACGQQNEGSQVQPEGGAASAAPQSEPPDPWQLTLSEFNQAYPAPEGVGEQQMRDAWRGHIGRALARGRDVPAQVRQEYEAGAKPAKPPKMLPDPKTAPPRFTVVPADEKFEPTDPPDDGFYYHVTTRGNATKIEKQGLTPGKRQSMSEGYYRDYSAGRVFLTDRGGVNFWKERIKTHLEAEGRRANLVVVRIPKRVVGDLPFDEAGTRDAHVNAYYSTDPVRNQKNLSVVRSSSFLSRIRTKAGFTGKKVDSAGRTQCYRQGEHVACGQQQGPAEQEPAGEAAAEQDWKQNGVRSKAFKLWFGDWESDPDHASKVVDRKTGEPKETAGTGIKEVYHGTQADFEEFKKPPYGSFVGAGLYFAENRKVAETFASGIAQRRPGQGGGRIISAYLNIRKPFDFDADLTDEDVQIMVKAAREVLQQESDQEFITMVTEAIDSLVDQQANSKGQGEVLSKHDGWTILTQGFGRNDINKVIQHAGWDGIVHTAQDPGGTARNRRHEHAPDYGRIWIAFEPVQVKSSGNRGTFDPSSANINKALPVVRPSPFLRYKSLTIPYTKSEERKDKLGHTYCVEKGEGRVACSSETNNVRQQVDGHEDVTRQFIHPSGNIPSSRPLESGFQRNNEVLQEDVANDFGVGRDRITRAEQGHVSKRSYDSKGDEEILAALAERGIVESGKAYRGAAFTTEEEAQDYIRKVVGQGFFRTAEAGPLTSFTEEPEVAERFAHRLSAQVMGEGKRNAFGVLFEVSGQPLRGYRFDYGEAEVVLPRGQTYQVGSITKQDDSSGFTTYIVKMKRFEGMQAKAFTGNKALPAVRPSPFLRRKAMVRGPLTNDRLRNRNSRGNLLGGEQLTDRKKPPQESLGSYSFDAPQHRTKGGFTGKKEDAVGRTQCYQQGEHVACGQQQTGGQTAGGVDTVSSTLPQQPAAEQPSKAGLPPPPKAITNIRGEKVTPPRTFYRATSEGGAPVRTGDEFWDNLLFAADNEDSARPYGKNIRTITAKPDAQILYEGSQAFRKLAAGLPKKGSLLDFSRAVAQRAKDAGYDAVWFVRQGDVGTAILNPDKFEDPNKTRQDQAAGKSLPAARDKALSLSAYTADPVAAGLAVLARDTGRVLLLQRALEEGDSSAGKWEFAGGHIEQGEDPRQAAEREWQEEVGLDLPAGEPAGEWRSSNGKYRGFVHVVGSEADLDLLARDSGKNPDGDRFEAVAWVDPADLRDHNLRPELQDDLKHVLRAVGAKSLPDASWSCPEPDCSWSLAQAGGKEDMDRRPNPVIHDQGKRPLGVYATDEYDEIGEMGKALRGLGLGGEFEFYRQAFNRWRTKPSVRTDEQLRDAWRRKIPADRLAIENDEDFRLREEHSPRIAEGGYTKELDAEVKGGFTGRKKDSAGRTQCYQQGEHVACGQQHSEKQRQSALDGHGEDPVQKMIQEQEFPVQVPNEVNEMMTELKKRVERLPKKLHDAVSRYAGIESGAYSLNEAMRRCKFDYTEECLGKSNFVFMQQLDQAIKQCPPFREPVVVFRGLHDLVFTNSRSTLKAEKANVAKHAEVFRNIVSEALDAQKSGRVFQFPSFTSVSPSAIAPVISFSGPLEGDLTRPGQNVQIGLMFAIKAKTGLVVPDSLTSESGEFEVIQSYTTKYRVMAVQEITLKGQHTLHYSDRDITGGDENRTVVFLEEVD